MRPLNQKSGDSEDIGGGVWRLAERCANAYRRVSNKALAEMGSEERQHTYAAVFHYLGKDDLSKLIAGAQALAHIVKSV